MGPVSPPASNDPNAALRAEDEHLLILALQLKAQLDLTNKDTLSIPVVRDAEQIEKLAHSAEQEIRQAAAQ